LSLSNIQISFGSVSNILRERKEGKVVIADETQETQSEDPESESESESRSRFLTDSQDTVGSIAAETDLRQALKIKNHETGHAIHANSIGKNNIVINTECRWA